MDIGVVTCAMSRLGPQCVRVCHSLHTTVRPCHRRIVSEFALTGYVMIIDW